MMTRSAGDALRQVRGFHRELERLYADAAAAADDRRVAMLLEYISEGHRQRESALTRSLLGASPAVLELECTLDFDAAASAVAGRMHAAVSFDEVMTLALRADRELHRALESAAEEGVDHRLRQVLQLVLQQSREMRNRLSFNAALLRDL